MKYFLLLLYPVFLLTLKADAQKEYKKSLGGITRVEILTEANVRIIKGSVNEIKVQPGCSDCGDDKEGKTDDDGRKDENDKAKGLKAIYAGGVDNTGIGMLVQQDGAVLKIKDLAGLLKRNGLTITLPSSVTLNLDCGSLGSITIDDSNSELELKTSVGNITLKKITGPVTAHTATGNIEADFSSLSQTSPVSLISSTGNIDVNLPANTKASVELKSVTAAVYTDFDLVIPRQDGLKAISGHKAISGNINNGGVKVSLKASTGNIYLRKK